MRQKASLERRPWSCGRQRTNRTPDGLFSRVAVPVGWAAAGSGHYVPVCRIRIPMQAVGEGSRLPSADPGGIFRLNQGPRMLRISRLEHVGQLTERLQSHPHAPLADNEKHAQASARTGLGHGPNQPIPRGGLPGDR